MSRQFFIALLFVLIAAPGCAVAAPAAKPGAPPPSKPGAALSKIVIFYPKPKTLSGLAKLIGPLEVNMTIFIDDQPVSTLSRGGYAEVTAAPGVRILKLKHTNDLFSGIMSGWPTKITVRPGKTQYFYVVIAGAGLFVNETDAPTALAAIASKPAAGSGTVVLFWPRRLLDFGLTDFLNPDRDVTFNGKKAGAFTIGDYIVLQSPAGNVDLGFPESLELFGTHQHTIFVGAGQTHYYEMYVGDYLQVIERTPAFAQQFILGLKKR